MANLADYKVGYFTFGPATIKIGPYSTGPIYDMGAVENVEVAIGTQLIQIFQGSPRTLVRQYIAEQSMSVAFVGLQVDPWRMRYAAGAGYTVGTRAVAGIGSGWSHRAFGSGGSAFVDELSIAIHHTSPEGWTMSMRVWKAQTTGETVFPFPEGDAMRIPFRFNALDSSTDWASANLPSNGRLYRIDQFAYSGLVGDSTAGLTDSGFSQ